MKGDKMAKRSSFGSLVRGRLSDITNSQPLNKSPSVPEKFPLDDSNSAKEHIEHLVKEKMALVKLIQDKNKIIEISGFEIKKLKTCVQKMQLQNWNLAQSNSQMLAELNMGKERMKTLQHELACKEVLLRTRNSQLKGKEAMNVQKPELQVCDGLKEPEVVIESGVDEDSKPCDASTRPRLSRSRSLGSSTISQQHTDKEIGVSKRRCVRRQSASSRIKVHEEPTENLFEIDDAKFPLTAPSDSPNVCVTDYDGMEARRTSMSRPSRKAAEKVHSYKERPINVKMRRPE